MTSGSHGSIFSIADSVVADGWPGRGVHPLCLQGRDVAPSPAPPVLARSLLRRDHQRHDPRNVTTPNGAPRTVCASAQIQREGPDEPTASRRTHEAGRTMTQTISEAPATRLEEDLLRLEAFAAVATTRRVSLVETHISWVFLLDRDVFKVKKPVDLGFLDFSLARAATARLRGRGPPQRPPRAGRLPRRGPHHRGADGRCRRRRGPGASSTGPCTWTPPGRRRGPTDSSRGGALGRRASTRLAARIARVPRGRARATTRSAASAGRGHRDRTSERTSRRPERTLSALPVARRGRRDRALADRRSCSDDEALFERAHRAAGASATATAICGSSTSTSTTRGGDHAHRLHRVQRALSLRRRLRGRRVPLDGPRRARARRSRRAPPRDATRAKPTTTTSTRVVDFYESYRAYVRAKVAAMLARDDRGADRGLRASRRAGRAALLPPGALGGPAAAPAARPWSPWAGSSRRARAPSPSRLGRRSSAPVVDADRTRKHLLGVDADPPASTMAPGTAPTTRAFTDGSTARCLRRAAVVLASGRPVVIDASFRSPRDARWLARDSRRSHGVPFRFVECRATRGACRDRLAAAERDRDRERRARSPSSTTSARALSP